jgi:hypothetical protein
VECGKPNAQNFHSFWWLVPTHFRWYVGSRKTKCRVKKLQNETAKKNYTYHIISCH